MAGWFLSCLAAVILSNGPILKVHPKHPVKLADLAGSKIIDVPRRDPMTMKPLAEDGAAHGRGSGGAGPKRV